MKRNRVVAAATQVSQISGIGQFHRWTAR